jgi:hypothetical protein
MGGGGFRTARAGVTRRKARSTKISRKQSKPSKRAKASRGRVVLKKGSPAAKAWGRKMARARKRK